MLSETRLNKIMEKLNRVQNAPFWGLKTWGQGGPGPPGPPVPPHWIATDPFITYAMDLVF